MNYNSAWHDFFGGLYADLKKGFLEDLTTSPSGLNGPIGDELVIWDHKSPNEVSLSPTCISLDNFVYIIIINISSVKDS